MIRFQQPAGITLGAIKTKICQQQPTTPYSDTFGSARETIGRNRRWGKISEECSSDVLGEKGNGMILDELRVVLHCKWMSCAWTVMEWYCCSVSMDYMEDTIIVVINISERECITCYGDDLMFIAWALPMCYLFNLKTLKHGSNKRVPCIQNELIKVPTGSALLLLAKSSSLKRTNLEFCSRVNLFICEPYLNWPNISSNMATSLKQGNKDPKWD